MTAFRKAFAAIAMVSTMLLAGCDLPRGAALQNEILYGAEDPNADFAVYPVSRQTVNYIATWPNATGPREHGWPGNTGSQATRIAPGDIVNVGIWDSELTSLLVSPGQRSTAMQNLRVSENGTVFIPYAGNVKISGMTPDAARRRLQERVSGVSPSAQVQITYDVGYGNSVDLIGGVRSPGSFRLESGGMTVLSLIAQGGGVDNGLENPSVGLIRSGRRYSMGYDRLVNNPSLDVALLGGDKVFVEDDERSFQALGASGRQQIVYFDRDQISARQAIAMIGGLNSNIANPRGVMVLRQYPQSAVGRGPEKARVVFTIDMTTADGLFSADQFMIAPDDLVLITESPLGDAQSVLGLIGVSLGLARTASAL